MTKSDGFSPRILLDIYRKALLIQLFDERMRSLSSPGEWRRSITLPVVRRSSRRRWA